MHVVIFCLLVLRCCIYCYHPPAVEHHSCIGDGLILIPEHRIAICLLPKVATTTWKFIAMVLAGQDPKEVCGCVQNEWGCLGGRINDHRVPQWAGTIWARQLNPARLSEIMAKGSEWNTIAMIREPWSRTISAFWEDNFKNELRINSSRFITPFRKCSLSNSFTNYLRRDQQRDTCHSRPMIDYCGLAHPSSYHFDHVLDISDSFDGLKEIFQNTTNEKRLTSGWESCMVGNSTSFYNARLKSPHTMGGGNLSFWTQQFCTKESESLFLSKYAGDLKMYSRFFPMKTAGCIPPPDNEECM